MNYEDNQTFKQAVNLAQSGSKSAANAALSNLVKTNPADATLLLWWAFTSDDLTMAQRAIAKAAALDPANPAVAEARRWLEQQKPAAATVNNTTPPFSVNTTANSETYSNTAAYSSPAVNLSTESVATANSTAQVPTVSPVRPQYGIDDELNPGRVVTRPNFLTVWLRLLIFGALAFLITFGGVLLLTGGSILTPTYTSPNKDFSVLMPYPVQIANSFVPTAAGPQSYNLYLDEKTDSTANYMVVHMDLLPALVNILNQQSSDDKAKLTALTYESIGLHVQILPKTIDNTINVSLPVNPYPGRDFEYQSSNGDFLKVHAYLVGFRFYAVMVRGNTNTAMPLDPQRFFDSFKIN